MYDLWAAFDPAQQQIFEENLNKIRQTWKDNRDCYVCRFCRDMSDRWNTCHLCRYTNDLLPEEHTCLLWELGEVSEN